MSSQFVRTQITNFLTTNAPTENLIDLTAQYETIDEIIDNEGLGVDDPWLGLQFIGSTEEPQTIIATNSTGCYRELGSIFLHVVARASQSATMVDDILTRSEALRDLLRGRRINSIIVESVSPPNFEQGATLDLEGGYTSASVIVNYYRDNNI